MSSAWAHSPAPAPAPGTETAAAPTADCLANLLNMSDCVPYAEVGSNLTKPDKACCPELAGLVEGAPQCLCYLFDGKTAQQFGINVDMDRALKLPSVCSVATPPTSLCSRTLRFPISSFFIVYHFSSLTKITFLTHSSSRFGILRFSSFFVYFLKFFFSYFLI